jgi:hypothetical protein
MSSDDELPATPAQARTWRSHDPRTEEARSSMRTIPNFRAQGLITNDHDLGAAMSQSPRAERALPRLYSTTAATERN